MARSQSRSKNRTNLLIAGITAALVIVLLAAVGITIFIVKGGLMAAKPAPPKTPEEAWRRLEGSWSYGVKSSNSVAFARYRFTPNRKFIFSAGVRGGVLPEGQGTEIIQDVTNVAVDGEDIRLTFAPGPGGPGGTATFRFVGANKLSMEGEPPFTREE